MTTRIHHTLPGPDDINRSVLPNGVTITTRANFNSPSVVVSGYLPCGSLLPNELLSMLPMT